MRLGPQAEFLQQVGEHQHSCRCCGWVRYPPRKCQKPPVWKITKLGRDETAELCWFSGNIRSWNEAQQVGSLNELCQKSNSSLYGFPGSFVVFVNCIAVNRYFWIFPCLNFFFLFLDMVPFILRSPFLRTSVYLYLNVMLFYLLASVISSTCICKERVTLMLFSDCCW